MDSKPLCILVIGMAGSGKSTFLTHLHRHLTAAHHSVFCVNLDPAVKRVAFPASIDICDAVNYKNLMKQYALGPNGGIMTALNVWATKIDQFIGILEAKTGIDYILVDTPGQMEVFSWSASGTIIADTLASGFPTLIVFVADTVRCQDPNVFMSNMLYACSIYYKFHLPLLIAFNKCDVNPCVSQLAWMRDYALFQTALDEVAMETYLSSLNRSLSLVLDEFYANLPAMGVSSISGAGFEELIPQFQVCKREFVNEYWPELQRKRAELREQRAAASLQRLDEDREDMSPITNLLRELRVKEEESSKKE